MSERSLFIFILLLMVNKVITPNEYEPNEYENSVRRLCENKRRNTVCGLKGNKKCMCGDCKKGFSGIKGLSLKLPLCTDVNECDYKPCQNGGICLNTHGSYLCICQPNFSGVNCTVYGDYNYSATTGEKNSSTKVPSQLIFSIIPGLTSMNVSLTNFINLLNGGSFYVAYKKHGTDDWKNTSVVPEGNHWINVIDLEQRTQYEVQVIIRGLEIGSEIKTIILGPEAAYTTEEADLIPVAIGVCIFLAVILIAVIVYILRKKRRGLYSSVPNQIIQNGCQANDEIQLSCFQPEEVPLNESRESTV